jgi:hypothetical protein
MRTRVEMAGAGDQQRTFPVRRDEVRQLSAYAMAENYARQAG